MEKYFVNYNQSLALKELGFDEPCFGAYDTHKGDEWLLNIKSDFYYGQFSDKNDACVAPLKSQVFEFFREKHRLEPNIIFREYYYEDGDKNVYEVNIETNINSDFCLNITPLEGFKSYEEAESAAIDKLIELVKNK